MTRSRLFVTPRCPGMFARATLSQPSLPAERLTTTLEVKYTDMRLPLKMGNFFHKIPEAQNEAAMQLIRNQISKNCVVLFSKTYCPHCKKMKALFQELGIRYKAIELDLRDDAEIIQNALLELTGARTVPRVFVNGTNIGGVTDTLTLHSEGKLLPLVERCSPPCTLDKDRHHHHHKH